MINSGNSEISLYMDTIIVETILLDDKLLLKHAQTDVLSSLIEKVKHYVGNNINPSNKTNSILKILAPGAIYAMFSAIGLGWLGTLVGLATKVFNIDVLGALGSIYDKIKSLFTGGNLANSSQVDSIVNQSVKEHVGESSEEDITKGLDLLSKSFDMQLREAKLLKLAIVEYDYITKNGGIASALLSLFSKKKGTTTSLLSKILGWIFKIILASAGFMVAGDAVNKLVGRPNAFDDTIQNGKPVETPVETKVVAPVITSKQTKFKVNPSYNNESKNSGSNWAESISNDEQSIESMLLGFAKQVYSGLNGLDSVIRSSPAFQVVKGRIVFYNRSAQGGPIVFLPKYFTSKKQLVDFFIDDVAERAS